MPSTLTPATKEVARPLTFDERLALSKLAMDSRLDQASAAINVNTAHFDTDALEILAAPMPAATPPVTVNDVYREAARLIATHGWIRNYAGNVEIGFCLIGAIRKAAGGNRRLEGEAEEEMLARILRQCPDALSIGAWNDSQSGSALVIRMLG